MTGRWIVYRGGLGNRCCTFCHEYIENGATYYRSSEHGTLCKGHAAFLLGVRPDDPR